MQGQPVVRFPLLPPFSVLHYVCSERFMAQSCVFCKRQVPTRGHHMVPRCKGGTEIVPACHSCEDFIHKTWSHNELRDTFNTVETILADARFQKFLKWLYKQQETAVSDANVVELGGLKNIGSATSWRKLRSISPSQRRFSTSDNSTLVCGLVSYSDLRSMAGKYNKYAVGRGTASAAKCN